MVIIIGGGISGLAAACELAERRIPFRLLEASPRAGGLILTERTGGFTIDAGPDAMLGAKASAREWCGALGLAPRVQEVRQPRTAFVFDRDRLFPLPSPSVLGIPLTMGAAARFRLLPMQARLRVALEPFIAAAAPRDESVASLFTRRFGAATVGLIAQPLLGGIHAGDAGRLSARSLFPQLLEAEERNGSILRGARHRIEPERGVFFSLRGGMETLPQTAAGRLPPGAVRYRAEVSRVVPAADGWRIETTDGTESAGAVLFATPVHVTARLLAAVDTEAAALLGGIEHTSTVTVALAWPRAAVAHPLRGSGFVVANGLRITACTWISSKWEERAPAGYALVRAFLGGAHDPAAIELPDEELIAAATRDLGYVLGALGRPELARVYRWRHASPQLVVGHGARAAQIAERLSAHRGLFVTGRGFRAVGIPDCISDARQAAREAAERMKQEG